MNKIFISLLLIFILIFSINYFVNAQDEPQESPVTGYFQTENSPPNYPTYFEVKDGYSGGSTYDSYEDDEEAPGSGPDNYIDTHITYNHNCDDTGNGDCDDNDFQWVEGTDPDQNSELVKTLICIASDPAYLDGPVALGGTPNCDILNKFDYDTTGINEEFYNLIDPDDSAFDYSDTDVTYYVRLVTCDGYDVTNNDTSTGSYSNYIDRQIHVINSQPNIVGDPVVVSHPDDKVIPTPSDENTHSTEPYFDWPDGTDPDDGLSVDHYPADILTYNLETWDTGETTQYLSSAGIGLINSEFIGGEGTWDNPLVWEGSTETAPGSGVASLQYLYKIFAIDNGNLQSEKQGNFNLYDNIPTVQVTALADYYGYESDLGLASVGLCSGSGGCIISPHDNREYATFNISVYITEPDEDCELALNPGDIGHRLFLHLCDSDDGSGNCNDEDPLHPYLVEGTNYEQLDSLELSSGPTCSFTFQSYLDETDGTPSFYLPKRVVGSGDTQYELFVNVTSHSGVKNSNDHLTNGLSQWEYDTGRFLHLTKDLQFTDEASVRVGSDPVSYGKWNPGDEHYVTRNWGNIAMDSEWTANEDFFNDAGDCPAGTETWTIYSFPTENNDFLVDDDSLHPEGVETGESYQIFTGISSTSGPFTHSPNGIVLCTTYDCTGDTGAILDTYFHIRPTTSLGGFCSGEYSAELEFTDLEH